eukprot:CAMPEP_0198253584 /NCGR_PEP_ID=MMETSP1447-20131203/3993_1 /TAXON_ID=420782 /ORGANISM="Chaetoceros dichaeta, Strain CCMP1751" /LENGTH=374 /DNA_ID=CAMNT_0043939315 /DNA_START=31 /DNA_END=1155 /DNA_ORIENTATION=+
MQEVLKNNGFQSALPGFGTPEKLHVPFSSEVKMEFEDEVGNRITGPLNFKPTAASHDEISSESNLFTLRKLLGMGTDTFTIDPSLRTFKGKLPIEQYKYEPLTAHIPTADGDMREMTFTDGGYVDGTGIPALVNQKTKNIISVWCPSPFFRTNNIASDVMAGIGSFFGLLPRDTDQIPFNFAKLVGIHNHMFNLNSNGENQMKKLIKTMESLDAAGEPTIATLKDVEVIDNPFWGISGGWKLDLTLCLFTGVPTKFADKISEEIVGTDNVVVDRLFTNENFKDVPNVVALATFPEDAPIGTDLIGQVLPPLPARMTQIMLSWAIKHSWDGLEVDGEIMFGGFRAIFEEKGKNSRGNKAPKSQKGTKGAKIRKGK